MDDFLLSKSSLCISGAFEIFWKSTFSWSDVIQEEILAFLGMNIAVGMVTAQIIGDAGQVVEPAVYPEAGMYIR